MLKLYSIATTLFLLVINSHSQSTFFKVINNSELTESILNIYEIAPGKYLINSFTQNENTSGFGGISALYMIDDSGYTTDSLFIPAFDQYFLQVNKMIRSLDNEIIFLCNAMDSISMDVQLCLLKTDYNLKISSINLFGMTTGTEFIYDFCINSNNNLIFVGSTTYDPTLLENYYLLWEMDFLGNTIQLNIDSTYHVFKPDIIQMPGTGKYYIHDGANGLLIFNLDLELDTMCMINPDSTGFYAFPQDHKLIDNHRYLKTGIQFVFDSIGVPIDPFDMAFVILNEDFLICDKYVFGNPDTIDLPRNIDWIDTNRIFLSGVKNYTNLPPEDSWLSLYITNLQGEIIHNKYYGGYGSYTVGTGLATSDGGYIIASSWFDFANYIPPNQADWDIVILKVDSEGLITNIDTQFPFEVTKVIVYPNPVKDNLHFVLGLYSNLQLSMYNFTGERVVSQSLHHSQTIDISMLPAGIYVYLLTGKNGFKETGKIIKE